MQPDFGIRPASPVVGSGAVARRDRGRIGGLPGFAGFALLRLERRGRIVRRSARGGFPDRNRPLRRVERTEVQVGRPRASTAARPNPRWLLAGPRATSLPSADPRLDLAEPGADCSGLLLQLLRSSPSATFRFRSTNAWAVFSGSSFSPAAGRDSGGPESRQGRMDPVRGADFVSVDSPAWESGRFLRHASGIFEPPSAAASPSGSGNGSPSGGTGLSVPDPERRQPSANSALGHHPAARVLRAIPQPINVTPARSTAIPRR